MMIEKIASHLGDFSPRLQSNTRALYQVGNFFTVELDVQKILDYKLAQFLHAGLEFVYYQKAICKDFATANSH